MQAQEFAAIIGLRLDLCDQVDHRLRRRQLERSTAAYWALHHYHDGLTKLGEGRAERSSYVHRQSERAGQADGKRQLLREWLLLRTVKPHRWRGCSQHIAVFATRLFHYLAVSTILDPPPL